MKQLIVDVIAQFGGREAASDEERRAQLFLKERLGRFCDKVILQEFSVAARAKFQSLKIFCILYYVSLVIFLYYPIAACIISLVNSILFLGHFVTYYNWLDFLFPKKTSRNVIGSIEPSGDVLATVIISGHMDSAREFIWWWRWKQFGLILTIISGFLIALLPIYIAFFLVAELTGNPSFIGIVQNGWWLFILLAPVTITMFNIHGKNIAPGAQDNLSGVATAVGVGEYFSKNRLKHTRIKVAGFGSEEIGLRGAKAYAKTFNLELKAENATCINLDGIKDADELFIVLREPMILTKYPKPLIDRLEASFKAVHVKCQKKPIPFGATDGSSFIREGIPAVSIIGMTTDYLDPTYHTRLDVPECVDPKALEDTRKVLVHFIEAWDRETG